MGSIRFSSTLGQTIAAVKHQGAGSLSYEIVSETVYPPVALVRNEVASIV
jgi:hypothetical protein